MVGAAVSVVFFNFKPMSLFLSKKYGNKSKEELENFDNRMDSLISKYKFVQLNIKKNDGELTEEQKNASENYQKERSEIFNDFRFNLNKIKIEKELNPESEYQIISSNKNLKIDEDLTKYNSDQRAKIEKIKIGMISRTRKSNDYKRSSDEFLKNRLSKNVDTESKFKNISNK
jgi:small-conductance mechanosensitive channel